MFTHISFCRASVSSKGISVVVVSEVTGMINCAWGKLDKSILE